MPKTLLKIQVSTQERVVDFSEGSECEHSYKVDLGDGTKGTLTSTSYSPDYTSYENKNLMIKIGDSVYRYATREESNVKGGKNGSRTATFYFGIEVQYELNGEGFCDITVNVVVPNKWGQYDTVKTRKYKLKGQSERFINMNDPDDYPTQAEIRELEERLSKEPVAVEGTIDGNVLEKISFSVPSGTKVEYDRGGYHLVDIFDDRNASAAKDIKKRACIHFFVTFGGLTSHNIRDLLWDEGKKQMRLRIRINGICLPMPKIPKEKCMRSSPSIYYQFDYRFYGDMKETKSLFGKKTKISDKDVVLEVLDVEKVIWSKKVGHKWKEYDHCNIDIRI